VIAPAFSNNTLGNIFPATPASCAPALPPALPNTGGTPAVPGGAPAASSAEGTTSLISAASNSASGASSFGRVSLSTYLAGTRTGNTSSNGIFIGKYAYVHTLAGLQIFAIVPDTQLLAMRD
jgi:hypothetical protein